MRRCAVVCALLVCFACGTLGMGPVPDEVEPCTYIYTCKGARGSLRNTLVYVGKAWQCDDRAKQHNTMFNKWAKLKVKAKKRFDLTLEEAKLVSADWCMMKSCPDGLVLWTHTPNRGTKAQRKEIVENNEAYIVQECNAVSKCNSVAGAVGGRRSIKSLDDLKKKKWRKWS